MHDRAVALHRESIQVAAETQKAGSPYAAIRRVSFGMYLRDRGFHQEALDPLGMALKAFQASEIEETARFRALALELMAEIELALGNIDAALLHSERSVQLAKTYKFAASENGSWYLLTFAKVLVEAGECERAMATLEAVDKAVAPWLAHALEGRCQLAEKDLRGARASFSELIHTMKSEPDGWDYPKLKMLADAGRVLPLSDVSEALAGGAEVCAQPHGDGGPCAWVLALYAGVAEAEGKPDEAAARLARAREELENAVGPVPYRSELLARLGDATP